MLLISICLLDKGICFIVFILMFYVVWLFWTAFSLLLVYKNYINFWYLFLYRLDRYCSLYDFAIYYYYFEKEVEENILLDVNDDFCESFNSALLFYFLCNSCLFPHLCSPVPFYHSLCLLSVFFLLVFM